ncbi:MAG: hypothetical protein DRJ03_00095 [Chloroflexi bacterium]|nr:MAG: hypothetical protein DRJ03_00095 [Chloroflexota bacterium]
MDDLLPTVARCRVNGITLEVYHGEIPDVCRLLRFDPITEFELPDAKASDEDFEDWLALYRHAKPWFAGMLLEEAKCN